MTVDMVRIIRILGPPVHAIALRRTLVRCRATQLLVDVGESQTVAVYGSGDVVFSVLIDVAWALRFFGE